LPLLRLLLPVLLLLLLLLLLACTRLGPDESAQNRAAAMYNYDAANGDRAGSISCRNVSVCLLREMDGKIFFPLSELSKLSCAQDRDISPWARNQR
jgi:hypothetical protein